LIPVEDQSPSYFLGPVGTSDPFEFIEAESQRIPFKEALSKPHEWQDAFKDWPLPPIAGWRNWYKRCLMMTVLKQAIGTAFALPIVWNYPWLKHQKMRIF
jgi:hypothetical protein